MLKIKRFVVGPLQTNCYVVSDPVSSEGMLMDPGDYDPEIEEYARAEGIKILYTLNTHGHADHIKGNAVFAFPVLIHELDEPCLNDPGRNLSLLTEERFDTVSAERLLKDGDEILLGSVVLKVIHTPGHTVGGISILCGNMLFSGDTLFYEGVGRTDLPGGDYKMLAESMKKLMTLPDETRVFPGHGQETTIEHERRHNPFL